MATPRAPSRPARSLQRFRLDSIRDTGITVGEGAYATVLQYDFRGLKCVGKKMHRRLYEYASPPQRAETLRRFEKECELLGRLHHPNIVQFLGIHIETRSELPVLVMEYLPISLSDYLDRHGVLSAETGYGILRDVALGLRYLHEYSPPIVHRDLSANNVLLTASLSAKISDLGVTKILNISPSQMTQRMSTGAPGTPCYMPPEALAAQPSYTSKLDSYSFGVIVLHMLCGKWPFPTDLFQNDPHNSGMSVPVTEVDRRAELLQQMDSDHPLSGLVYQCLSNSPDERPESADILQQINAVLSQIPAPAETVFQQLEGLRSENRRLVTDIQRLPLAYGSEIERLKTENRSLRSENQKLLTVIQRQASDLLALGNEVQRLSLKKEMQTFREHSQTPPSSSCSRVNQPHVRRVERPLGPPGRAALKDTESQLHSGVRLRWRKYADIPVEIVGAQVVVVGENVYVGGGGTTARGSINQAFQYNWKGNVWSTLPRCRVKWFGMAHFMGKILTVGGVDLLNSPTCKVYALRKSQQWEEFLPPMLTARFFLSVATTSDSLIAAGGDTSVKSPTYTSAVEVYSNNTSQWHTVDPLPVPSIWMSSVTIYNICYLLGGKDQNTSAPKNCWCAFLPSLIQKAVSPTSRSPRESIWKQLPPTPFCRSSAACLGGSLLAVGGDGYDASTRSPAVYAFLNNSWTRLNGDLLSPRSFCATAQLSPVKMIAIGGWDKQGYRSKEVFIGTLHS